MVQIGACSYSAFSLFQVGTSSFPEFAKLFIVCFVGLHNYFSSLSLFSLPLSLSLSPWKWSLIIVLVSGTTLRNVPLNKFWVFFWLSGKACAVFCDSQYYSGLSLDMHRLYVDSCGITHLLFGQERLTHQDAVVTGYNSSMIHYSVVECTKQRLLCPSQVRYHFYGLPAELTQW